MKIKDHIQYCKSFILAFTVLIVPVKLLISDCNLIPHSDVITNENGYPDCHKTIQNKQECVKPSPDDHSKGCVIKDGRVRVETYLGEAITIVDYDWPHDQSYCKWPAEPTVSTEAGQISRGYTCDND